MSSIPLVDEVFKPLVPWTTLFDFWYLSWGFANCAPVCEQVVRVVGAVQELQGTTEFKLGDWGHLFFLRI
jgi:hypothetical protein